VKQTKPPIYIFEFVVVVLAIGNC